MLMLSAVASGAPTLDTIHNVDALTLLRALPDACVDMTLTSPPYDKLRQYKGYLFDFEPIACELYRVTKTCGVVVWVVGDSVVNGSETLTSFRQALYFKECGFNVWDTMIWDKGNTFEPANVRYFQVFEYMFIFSKGKPIFNPLMKQNRKARQIIRSTSRKTNGITESFHGNGKYFGDCSPLNNIWEIDTGFLKATHDISAFDHPAIFPELLAERHIHTWSNPGDLVLDPFMGSGTTAKIARNLGRHYLGCDISSEYVNIARTRLAQTDPYQPRTVAPGVIQASLFSEVQP